jgi:hypothetical protein
LIKRKLYCSYEEGAGEDAPGRAVSPLNGWWDP